MRKLLKTHKSSLRKTEQKESRILAVITAVVFCFSFNMVARSFYGDSITMGS